MTARVGRTPADADAGGSVEAPADPATEPTARRPRMDRKVPEANEAGRFELVLFMISTGLFQASRLGVNLVAAGLLLPSVFGTWNLIVVLQTYTTHANLGLLSGANRRVPLLLGRGAHADAQLTERTAFGGSLLAGTAIAVVAAGLGLVAGGSWRGIALLIGFVILSQQLYLCGQVLLRGNLQFGRASVQQVVLALAFPILGLPGLVIAGVDGLIAAQGVAYALGFGLVILWRPDLRPSFDRALAAGIVREGLPIMLVGLAFAVMTSVDRWAIVRAGDATELGQYALASTISASMMFVNIVIAQQLYPRMAHAYGSHGRLEPIRALARRQGLLAGGMVVLMATLLAILAPLLTPPFFPAYVASIGAIQVLGFAYAALALASGFTNMLVTIGSAWRLLALHLATAAVAAILAVGALDAGFGLTGVALAMLVAFSGFALAAWWLARISRQPVQSAS